jgi:hypothetical protein
MHRDTPNVNVNQLYDGVGFDLARCPLWTRGAHNASHWARTCVRWVNQDAKTEVSPPMVAPTRAASAGITDASMPLRFAPQRLIHTASSSYVNIGPDSADRITMGPSFASGKAVAATVKRTNQRISSLRLMTRPAGPVIWKR